MKKEINCLEFLETLSDYVDGVLGDALCKEIETHMENCEDCRIVVDTLEKTIYLYHETSAKVTVPLGVRERLFRSLDLEDFIREGNEQKNNVTF